MKPTMSRRRRLQAAAFGAKLLLVACIVAAVALADGPGKESADQTAPSHLQSVPAAITAAFPVLAKPTSATERQQIPMVTQAIAGIERGGIVDAGANPELGRAYYTSGSDTDYLVPGSNGVLCIVTIRHNHPSRVGCSTAPTVESKGTLSLTVVKGGYDVTGLLPRGTSSVHITSMDGHTTMIAVNADGGFDYAGTGALSRITYTLPDGAEVVESTRFPPEGS